ncbi:MAG TPA: autotransporter-associated beta strand repeat-containing protein, partial [Pirellulales bacterium]
YFPYDVVVAGDATIGNNNSSNMELNNLTVGALSTGSPINVVLNNAAGANTNYFAGNLTLEGPANIYISSATELIQGSLQGAGSLTKWGTATMYINGDSSGYSQPVTVNQGVLATQNGSSSAAPFGTGSINVQPGGEIRLANVNDAPGGLTLTTDVAELATVGLAYNGPLPAMTINTTGAYGGVIGIDIVGYNNQGSGLDMSAIGNGTMLLGSTLGGNYTAPTLGVGSDNTYRLGGGGSTLTIETPVLVDPIGGGSNSVTIGAVSNGAASNSLTLVNDGGTVYLTTPNSYTGTTTLNTGGALEIGNNNALGDGLSTIIFNGGILEPDSSGIAVLDQPRTLANPITFTGDAQVNMNATNFNLAGNIALSNAGDGSGSGTVRTINVDNTNGLVATPSTLTSSTSVLTLSGVISDGSGTGNSLTKTGAGYLAITGTSSTYTGFTNINGGEIIIAADNNIPLSSAITMNGGGIGVFNPAGGTLTTNRDYTLLGLGAFDVGAGQTLVQSDQSNINGLGTLTKYGAGTMVLGGANSYNATTIDSGVLSVSNNVNLGDTTVNGVITFAGANVIPLGTNTPPITSPAALLITSGFQSGRSITTGLNQSGTIDVAAGQTFTQAGMLANGTDGLLTKAGQGTLLAAANNAVIVESGTPASGKNTITALADTGSLFVGEPISGSGIPIGATIIAITSTTGITISANATASTATPLTFGGLTNFAISGGGTFAATPAYSGLVETGTLVSAKNTVTGLASTSGLFIGEALSGAGIPVGATIASITSATAITFSGTASAAETNTPLTFAGTLPFDPSATISLNGGTLSLFQPAVANANYAVSAATINFAAGGVVSLEDNATNATQLNVTNLDRVGQGTLVIQAVNGQLGVTGVTGENLLAANVLGLSTSYQLSTLNNNGIVSPAIVSADASGNASFVTYGNQAQGFVPYAGPTLSDLAGSTDTSIVSIAAGNPQTLLGTTAVYGLQTADDISGGTLAIQSTRGDVVTSGGLLINGIDPTISSNLIFGDSTVQSGLATVPNGSAAGEALVYVANAATLSGTVTATNFTKFGPGALNFSGTNNALLGTVMVQQGSISFASSASVPQRMSLVLNDTGTLDLAGQRVAVVSLSNGFTTGGGIVTNSSATPSLLAINGGVTAAVSGAAPVIMNGNVTGTTSGLISGLSSTVGLYVGELVSGTGVPANAYITQIVSPTSIDISANGSAVANGSALTFTSELTTGTTFAGQIMDGVGTVALEKSGAGTLILGGQNANDTLAGDNTYTGGTVITQGTLQVLNPYALGGYNNTLPGDVSMYGGVLDIRSDGGGPKGILIIGNQNTDGITLDVQGPSTVNVQSDGVVSSVAHNIQVGILNIGEETLTITGANSYSLNVGGALNLSGNYAAFNTTTAAPSGVLEINASANITDGGAGTALVKLGTGTMTIDSSNNTYSGGTYVVAGTLQVTATTGTPLGSGPVQINPAAALRVAGPGSVAGTSSLTVLSAVNSFGAVAVDNDSFDPATVFGSALTNSIYGASLQIDTPTYNQPIDMSTIGNGSMLLGAGGGVTAEYLAPTLGAGVGNIYRLGGGGSFQFVGPDNVLTGDNLLEIGSPLYNVATVSNGAGTVYIENSNNYTGGTLLNRSSGLVIYTGGAAAGSNTPLGTGDVEVFGTMYAQQPTGTFASQTNPGQNTNDIILRPGGIIELDYSASNYLGAGDNGRWGDNAPLDLNGGTLEVRGNASLQTIETVGVLTVDKASTLQVDRATGAGSAQLTVASLVRANNGTLAIVTTTAAVAAVNILGLPTSNPSSYDRLVVTDASNLTNAGTTTGGAGTSNGGLAPVWIVDATNNTYVNYQSNSGFQDILPYAAAGPAGGQFMYSNGASSGTISSLTGTAGTQTLDLSGAVTIGSGF